MDNINKNILIEINKRLIMNKNGKFSKRKFNKNKDTLFDIIGLIVDYEVKNKINIKGVNYMYADNEFLTALTNKLLELADNTIDIQTEQELRNIAELAVNTCV